MGNKNDILVSNISFESLTRDRMLELIATLETDKLIQLLNTHRTWYKIGRGRRMTEVDPDEVASLYKKGHSIKKLALIYDCSNVTIINRLKEAGVYRIKNSRGLNINGL